MSGFASDIAHDLTDLAILYFNKKLCLSISLFIVVYILGNCNLNFDCIDV